MKKIIGASLVTLAAFVATPQQLAPQRSFTYEVVSVKRHLLLVTGDDEIELHQGNHATSGDVLRTGSRSAADLEVAERAARFHIGTKTLFRLAHDRPGVLIEVERGSLRAIFGALPEGDREDRLVTTPSAVLAVRGTDYGIDVEKDGDTTVVVFEGTVEVSDSAGLEAPIQVGAGQTTTVRRGRAPSAPVRHGLTPGDWDRGRRVESTQTGVGGHAPSPGSPGRQPDPSRPGAGASSNRSNQGGSRGHGG